MSNHLSAEEDPFAAFGDDSDDNEEHPDATGAGASVVVLSEQEKTSLQTATDIALQLTQLLLKVSPKDPLSKRVIDTRLLSDDSKLRQVLEDRFQCYSNHCDDDPKYFFDAVVLSIPTSSNLNDQQQPDLNRIASSLIPGGYYVAVRTTAAQEDVHDTLEPSPWIFQSIRCDTQIHDGAAKIYRKWPCEIQSRSCPWLSLHDTQKELMRLAEAVVIRPTSAFQKFTAASISVEENNSFMLDETFICNAVSMLEKHGYCVIPQLVDPQTSRLYGKEILSDLREAATILKREGIDLYSPQDSTKDPESYYEMSMREDLRMDLRGGPRLSKLRGTEGNQPRTMTGKDKHSQDFLRGNATLLEIIRRTMNPTSQKYVGGNFGRYNFGGSGPEGGYQDLRLGILGGIVSLPGSADQAVHADTPHLFEHIDCLPAHYLNIFTPGCDTDPLVGQTSFIHGSHRLSYTSDFHSKGEDNSFLWKDIVRPSLAIGDVVIFDCRILHFGNANQSSSIERPLLYTNTTMHWFHDPKNWNERKKIFL